MELPMFPLGTALVPGQVLPLHVFEPRYRALVDACLAGDRCFGVVLIERGSEVGGGDTRFEVGTVARITEMAEFPDGRYALVCVGTDRIRVERWLPDAPFPCAEVEVLADPEAGADALAAREQVVAGLVRVVDAARALGTEVPDGMQVADDPIQAGWDATAMAPIGPIDVLEILNEDDPVLRLNRITVALAEAAELLELRLG